MRGRSKDKKEGLARILFRVLAGTFALVLALSLLSFYPLDPFLGNTGAVADKLHNLCGSLGANLAGLLRTLLGLAAWLVPGYILWDCFPTEKPKWHGRVAWLLLTFSVLVLLGAFGTYGWNSSDGQKVDLRWGGWLGSSLWPPMKRALGPVGLPLILILVIIVCSFVLAPMLMRALGRVMVRWFGERAWPVLRPLPWKGFQAFLGAVKHPFLTWRDKKTEDIPDLDASDMNEFRRIEEQDEPLHALERAEREALEFRKMTRNGPLDLGLPSIQSVCLETPSGEVPLIQSGIQGEILGEIVGPRDPNLPPAQLLRDLPPPPPPKKPLVDPVVVQDRFGRVTEQQPLGLTEPTPSQPISIKLEDECFSSTSGSDSLKLESTTSEQSAWAPANRQTLPPRRLFDPPHPSGKIDLAVLEATKELVGQKLAEFKVKGQVTGLQPGPVVTVYEFQPDPGIPLAKVLGMEEDLALGLQAEKVRIDRIPGRNLVGIEVPNPMREVISFREVIDSPMFRDPSHKDARSLLTMALGKDMNGHPVVADLAKMPHLLIGGSTGSGKSVGVNAMICSVLLRALPHEVKMILVDPKMVELGVYEGIPHLWAPVVTDMKEAGRVLKWVVAQMEDRYRRLAVLSVRNLEQFNAKVQSSGGSIDLSDRTPNPRWPDRPASLEELPYVVVVIDELADLMMVARSEVEESIARIAQKARAVGIHLVLATQRPSVDIVTGVIKANLSCRLSYRVNTKIDSRTILDSSGGEQLLGKGDALFLAPGTARPRRIHAPLITEDEILRLVEWLKAQGKPDFNDALLQAMSIEDDATQETNGVDLLSGGSDDIYVRALSVVKRERKASTSLLQRKLNLGYGRAARIIDRMEDEGVIGPDRGAGKPREVLVGEE